MEAEIDGIRKEFDVKRPNRTKVKGEVYIGRSRTLWYAENFKVDLKRTYYFFVKQDGEVDTKWSKPTAVVFGKLNHLLQSAWHFRERMRTKNQCDTDLYFALTKLISDSAEHYNKTTHANYSKEFYFHSLPNQESKNFKAL